jgi:hypothetical protein
MLPSEAVEQKTSTGDVLVKELLRVPPSSASTTEVLLHGVLVIVGLVFDLLPQEFTADVLSEAPGGGRQLVLQQAR